MKYLLATHFIGMMITLLFILIRTLKSGEKITKFNAVVFLAYIIGGLWTLYFWGIDFIVYRHASKH